MSTGTVIVTETKFFFSEHPISIEVGNNKIIKKQQKNCINYKEKINTTTKENDMKKSVSAKTKGMSNED